MQRRKYGKDVNNFPCCACFMGDKRRDKSSIVYILIACIVLWLNRTILPLFEEGLLIQNNHVFILIFSRSSHCRMNEVIELWNETRKTTIVHFDFSHFLLHQWKGEHKKSVFVFKKTWCIKTLESSTFSWEQVRVLFHLNSATSNIFHCRQLTLTRDSTSRSHQNPTDFSTRQKYWIIPQTKKARICLSLSPQQPVTIQSTEIQQNINKKKAHINVKWSTHPSTSRAGISFIKSRI